jgi:hypothetical protein
MKTSELIVQLAEQIANHGDSEIVLRQRLGPNKPIQLSQPDTQRFKPTFVQSQGINKEFRHCIVFEPCN